jgi:hypothetical protein
MAMPDSPPPRSTSAARLVEQRDAVPHQPARTVRHEQRPLPDGEPGLHPQAGQSVSSRISDRWLAASSAGVVHDWPVSGTYWRGSSQIGHAGGGSSVSANWVPQVTQM